MVRYGLFRGEKLASNIIFKNLQQALSEKDKWNKKFQEYKKATGEIIPDVEVKIIKQQRKSVEKKLRDMFG